MKGPDLLLISTPQGLIAQPPYPERVVFSREVWVQTRGKLTAPNGEPITYQAVAYEGGRLVLAERVVGRVEV